MKTIETTATIGEDHILNIQLPNTISPGDTDIIIIDEKSQKLKRSTKRPPFPQFKPIPLKGDGPTAAEMVIQDRNERQQKISGSL